MIICAPRLEPPCSTKWVNSARSCNQDTEPLDFPLTPFANAFFGRSVEPLVPTPPPRAIISITSALCLARPSLESSIKGIT